MITKVAVHCIHHIYIEKLCLKSNFLDENLTVIYRCFSFKLKFSWWKFRLITGESVLKTILPSNFFHLINTMYQDTKDKFHAISTFVKDTEKYVEDVNLNEDKYNNYWIKTIMVNNMSSSISCSERAFSTSGRTS